MLSFLIKTLLDNTYTPIVYEYILLVYCIIFAKQNFFLLLSEDRGGILSFLNRVRRGFLTSFSIGNNTWNSSGISIQNGGQSRRFQIDMLSFLNIKKKDNIHTPKWYKCCLELCITCLYHYFCWTVHVFSNFILLLSEDKPGPEDICHFNYYSYIDLHN